MDALESLSAVAQYVLRFESYLRETLRQARINIRVAHSDSVRHLMVRKRRWDTNREKDFLNFNDNDTKRMRKINWGALGLGT